MGFMPGKSTVDAIPHICCETVGRSDGTRSETCDGNVSET